MEEWLGPLEDGEPEAAWDAFLSRYRPLIFATIRHHAQDHDDVMDLFTSVCEALREDGLARLRRYAEGGAHRARFSTWLVVVVRNLTIDRLRATHGRRRLPAAAECLPPLQKQIFERVFVQKCGHREAYELIRGAGNDLPFGRFLRELAAVYRAAQSGRGLPAAPGGSSVGAELSAIDAPALEERDRRLLLETSLAALPAADAAAVRLYVMDGLPAAEVARLLDLPDAKAVYNRVYRVLAVLRARLREAGYQHAGDL